MQSMDQNIVAIILNLISDMNEHVSGGKCLTPGCKALGEIAADSYTLVKLGVVGRRGRVCQGCLRGAEVSKRQLLSTVLSRMPTSGGTGRMQAGGDLRRSRSELDEAPELLTVEDSEDEEGEEVAEEEGKDIVEVYGGDSGVGDVVRKVATKMGLQRGQGYEEKHLGMRVERLQGQVEGTHGMFRDLEREMEDIHQLLYSEVVFYCVSDALYD